MGGKGAVPTMMRIQKYLASAGLASRRKCEEWVKQRRVKINGAVCELGASVDPETDIVLVDDAVITKPSQKAVLAFYKPKGVVCAMEDPEGRKTIADFFIDYPLRLFHVGRLDYNSEGLLLMTNDGDLAFRLAHPRFAVEKVYAVICDGILSRDKIKKLQSGVMLEDGPTAPATLQNIRTIHSKNGLAQTAFKITIREGRNRQIRRMLQAVSHEVLFLRREKIGNLSLGDLSPGAWRELSPDEIQTLVPF